MAGRGVPGVAPQTAKREQYAVLIAKGVGNAEACRIVGINRRTGKRWRHGRKITSSSGSVLHYAPVVGGAPKAFWWSTIVTATALWFASYLVLLLITLAAWPAPWRDVPGWLLTAMAILIGGLVATGVFAVASLG